MSLRWDTVEWRDWKEDRSSSKWKTWRVVTQYGDFVNLKNAE